MVSDSAVFLNLKSICSRNSDPGMSNLLTLALTVFIKNSDY